ncbi:hypothetical protein DWY69_21235 [Eisenbergiella massiliensis]|uniref:Uncharacterized protein n=1 Tax=Eisenbergiella massiliensis TaxID=1720294 RepID=A0A3E3ILK4_9FIRM|nr:hypothetical protein DWY69_21235 [Eisenbergiella massiliensis]
MLFLLLLLLRFKTRRNQQLCRNQIPRCKQRDKLAALQSSGVFDPRGSRQISMQAWLLGSLLAGIKKIMPFCFHFNTYFHWIHLFILPSLRKFSVLPYPPPAGKTGLILPCFPALLFP